MEAEVAGIPQALFVFYQFLVHGHIQLLSEGFVI